MWEYLKQVYHQGNSARQYQLELEITQYSQGTSSIQDYYTGFLNLWAEYDEIKYLNVSEAALSEIQKLQATSHRDQFLMKLRSEYEIICSNLMSRVPSPSPNECLNELLREEQSQLTQHVLRQQSSGNSPDIAYDATASYTPVVSHAKGQPPARVLSKIQCFGCKSYGHYASQCKIKFCNYCKSNGHVINDCKRRPQNRTPRAYHVNVADASTSSDSPSAPVMPSSPPASTTSPRITPKDRKSVV